MPEAALIAAARAVFAPGAEWIDPPYVLAADIPLELSGEGVRARLCMFTDARGNELAMRPDLTLPVASEEARRRVGGTHGETAYAYAARAFRLPAARDDPVEFTQVGFERFGAPSDPARDAQAFAQVLNAVEACAVKPLAIMTGDLAIFPAFVDSLGLVPLVAAQLKRAFRQEGGVRALLDAPRRALDPDLRNLLRAPEPAAALMTRFEASVFIGARTAEDIVEGLFARQAEDDAGGVPDGARQVLADLAAIECAADAAPDALMQLCHAHALKEPMPAIERFAARLAQMPGSPAPMRFRSGFGRRFTYYDGFVFEVLGDGLTDRQPIAAGGRYDGLLGALSSGQARATGIGGVVRPDRLQRILKASA